MKPLLSFFQLKTTFAIEIALAYQRLMDDYHLTQERMSERVGKKRATVANYLRLLKLPAQVQMAVKNHELEMGHARALLALDSPSAQLKLYKDVIKNGYSVRKVEDLVQLIKKGEDEQEAKRRVTTKPQLPKEFISLRNRLSELFQTKVQMTYSPSGKGKISIAFDDEEELERIMNTIDGIKNADH